MNWLTGKDEGFESALGLQPALADRYRAFLETVNSSEYVPGGVLTLCQARIAFIHGMTSEDVEASTDEEAAALAVAERIPYQHHQLEDNEVAEVQDALGDAGCVALLTALAFFDVSCRLNATLRGVS